MTDDDLRGRRKQETRADISRIAMAVVAADGIEALTADRIAAEAGISRRTLFNYFARLDDILAAPIDDMTADTIERVMERPIDEPLRDSLCTVLACLVDGPAFSQVRDLHRAAASSPSTARFLLELGERIALAFEEGLARRIGPAADPMYVAALAGAASAVLGRATRVLVESTVDEDEAAHLHPDYIRRAFELLFSGFDEAAAVSPQPTREP